MPPAASQARKGKALRGVSVTLVRKPAGGTSVVPTKRGVAEKSSVARVAKAATPPQDQGSIYVLAGCNGAAKSNIGRCALIESGARSTTRTSPAQNRERQRPS